MQAQLSLYQHVYQGIPTWPAGNGISHPRLSRRKGIAIRPSVSSGDAYQSPQQQPKQEGMREASGSEVQGAGTSNTNVQGEGHQQPGFWNKVKTAVLGDKKMDRQRLAELGFGAFAAYGVISNLNACVLMTMAWLTLVKTTGATPLMPGMWPKFIAIYGGLWLGAGFMRPIRLSLALGAAPSFDRALGEIMCRTRLNKIGAFAIMLVGIAAASFAVLGGVLFLLGGLP